MTECFVRKFNLKSTIFAFKNYNNMYLNHSFYLDLFCFKYLLFTKRLNDFFFLILFFFYFFFCVNVCRKRQIQATSTAETIRLTRAIWRKTLVRWWLVAVTPNNCLNINGYDYKFSLNHPFQIYSSRPKCTIS